MSLTACIGNNTEKEDSKNTFEGLLLISLDEGRALITCKPEGMEDNEINAILGAGTNIHKTDKDCKGTETYIDNLNLIRDLEPKINNRFRDDTSILVTSSSPKLVSVITAARYNYLKNISFFLDEKEVYFYALSTTYDRENEGAFTDFKTEFRECSIAHEHIRMLRLLGKGDWVEKVTNERSFFAKICVPET